VDTAGQTRLRLWDARSGAELGSASPFDAAASSTRIAALPRAGGEELVLIANTSTESIAVERRLVNGLTLNGSSDLLAGYGAIDIAAMEDGSRYGLLAVD